MTEKKDYLNELSKEVASKKIESFQEEKVVKVEKPKRKINVGLIIGGVVALVAAIILVWFLFFRPNISMPNFVGKTQNDIGAWAKQQGVETSGIIFMDEFNFEHDKGLVVSQSIDEGSNVGKDAKITFVLSKGADPDEAVAFPDIMNMTNSELKDWISENKLTKTKISTEYNDTIEKDAVISFELKNVEEADFTRGTTLNIKVSKGEQPAGTVTLEDFKDKDKAYVESWAKGKKVELVVDEVYHDTVAKGLVITQSIESGKTIKEGDVLTITVSKGKAIVLPDFTKMNAEQLTTWIADKDNSVVINQDRKRYNDDWTKYILEQSIKAGSSVESGETVFLTISIGKPRLTESYVGKPLQSLVDWVNAERHKGSDMYAGEWGTTAVYSSYPKGTIISMTCADAKGNTADCAGDLPLDARFTVTLSKGKLVQMKEADLATNESIISFLVGNQFNFKTDVTSDDNMVGINVNGTFTKAGSATNIDVKEDDTIIVITKQ